MPTAFAEYEQLVSSNIDDLHGETTKIERYKAGEFLATSADDSIAPVDSIVGIIDFSPQTLQLQDKGEYDGYTPNLAGDRVHISYDISLFSDPTLLPRQNDVITALKRVGLPKFRVTKSPDDDGLGRIVCVCVPSK